MRLTLVEFTNPKLNFGKAIKRAGESRREFNACKGVKRGGEITSSFSKIFTLGYDGINGF